MVIIRVVQDYHRRRVSEHQIFNMGIISMTLGLSSIMGMHVEKTLSWRKQPGYIGTILPNPCPAVSRPDNAWLLPSQCSSRHFKARIVKYLSASIRLFDKSLVTAGIFSWTFVMLVIGLVLLAFCTMNGQNTHEKTINLLYGLRKVVRETNMYKNMDPNLFSS